MNRLADSLSPYLLQHQHNPVDWYPWGEAAFDLARESDRPIFLSIGYAACHWCHVMERESFEDEAIAAMLNQGFVSIKVDREERPDIDQIYMNAVQVMTGQGGWPMSVFLDHQQRPFYAGTYWPPTQRFGMPGFAQVLDAITEAWSSRREEVEQHAGKMTDALQQLALGVSPEPQSDQGELLPDRAIDDATDNLLQAFDRRHGGFGAAPKFPHVTDLQLLIRRGHRQQRPELIDAALQTLDRMAAGGIRDHIGGGFARYSVDAKWLVPHFEKMLYDNALLAEVYVRAYQVRGEPRYAEVAQEILDYLCRDMVDAAGGFHCSEDADSEGVEGKYYVWTPAQVAEVIGETRADRFCQIYDITEGGNFEGENIPNLPQSIEHWASLWSIDLAELREELAADRDALLDTRMDRVRPGRDDKVLTAWNALAIRALAVAASVLDVPRYADAAVTAADFLFDRMTDGQGRLLHAFRKGEAHLDAYVDDYAFTIEAMVALFQATADSKWIEKAVALADQMIQRFEDPQAGGFFYTASDAETLITRNKDWHDGSLVSGNASAANALLKLATLCRRDDYRQSADRVLQAGREVMQQQSAACAALLIALDRRRHADRQWVLAVNETDDFRQWRTRLLAPYRPDVMSSWVIDGRDEPFAIEINRQREVVDGQTTLYRCQGFHCDLPLSGDAAVDGLETST